MESPLHLGQYHQTLHHPPPSYPAPSITDLGRRQFNTVRNNPTPEYTVPSFYPTSRPRVRELEIGQRGTLAHNWAPHTSHHLSQGNIYAEVDREYEVDSGYTEDSSDVTSKDDSLYTSSSSNSVLGYFNYDPKRTREAGDKGIPSVRGRTVNPKVFAISESIHGGKPNYPNEQCEEVSGELGECGRPGRSLRDRRRSESHRLCPAHQTQTRDRP